MDTMAAPTLGLETKFNLNIWNWRVNRISSMKAPERAFVLLFQGSNVQIRVSVKKKVLMELRQIVDI